MGNIGIYKITNKINNKVYIGQTINYKKRSKRHFSYLLRNSHHNLYLQRSYNKYGKDAFSIEMIKECEISELDQLEKDYILKYNSIDREYGYNLMDGGQKYRNFTDDVKMRMSLARKGKKLTKEHCRNISIGQKGRIITQDAINKANKTKKEKGIHLGEKNPNALITDETAKRIIISLLDGLTVKEIALQYETTLDTVYNIMYNKSYTHIMTDMRDKLKDRTALTFEDKIEKAIQLYMDGYSQNKIAKELNVSRNTLRREFSKRDIDTQLHKNQFVSKLIPR